VVPVRQVLAAAFLVALLIGPSADACTCGGGGAPCQAFFDAPAVFVGRVVSIDDRGDVRRRAHLAVTEAFRGVTSREIDVDTRPRRRRLSNTTFVHASGNVVTECGSPAAGAKVYLLRDHPKDHQIFSGPLLSEEQGRFTVAIPRGQRVIVTIEWPRPLPGKPYNWDRGDVPPFVPTTISQICARRQPHQAMKLQSAICNLK